MNKPYISLSIISFSLLLILGIIEKDAFINRKNIPWDPDKTVKGSMFRGYANYLSSFDAEISSYFDYTHSKNLDTVVVTSYMKTHHSWVKKDYRDESYLLRHEQYHFNISELHARKMRKAVLEKAPGQLSEPYLELMHSKYIRELNEMQYAYDEETGHSQNLEKQKDWEYYIDSLLCAYEIYADKMVIPEPEKTKSEFFRMINIDPRQHITGRYGIDSAIAEHSPCYHFTYENNKIKSIAFLNHMKPATDDFFGVSTLEILHEKDTEIWRFYDSCGSEIKNNEGVALVKTQRKPDKIIIRNFDRHGNRCKDINGRYTTIWDLDHKKRKYTARFYNIEGKQIRDQEGYEIMHVNYDPMNYVAEISNYDNAKQPLELQNGVFRRIYKHDHLGNITSVHSFDQSSDLQPYQDDIAAAYLHYDRNGNVICESYQDSTGTVKYRDDKIAVSYYKYDQYSNITEERHYGTNKNLIISKEGVGRIKKIFTKEGLVKSVWNFNAYDQLHNNINNICIWKYDYNERELICREKHYYTDTTDAISHLRTIQYLYDDNDNLERESYHNDSLKAIPDSAGVFFKRYYWNANNKLVEIRNYDRDSILHQDKEGIAVYVITYDENSNVSSEAYYDEHLKPTDSYRNSARVEFEYNDKNIVKETRYYGKDGKLSAGEHGVNVIRWEYDSLGRIRKESYFQDSDKPMTNENGIAAFSYEYDDYGNKVRIYFYDTDARLNTSALNGVAKVINRYNRAGKLSLTSYYDHRNHLTALPEGYAIESYGYNRKGFLTRKNFLSVFQQPVVTKMGFASVDWLYDLNDNIVAVVFRGTNNELIENEEGYAIQNWVYNRNGEVLNQISYKAVSGNLEKVDYGLFSPGNYHSMPNQKERVRNQVSYYNNGQKESEGTYINGKLEGEYRTWYEDGNLQSIIIYHNGLREGKMVEYYRNGQKWRELEYKNNTIVMESEVTWWENGNLRSMYVNGEREEWNEKGEPVES